MNADECVLFCVASFSLLHLTSSRATTEDAEKKKVFSFADYIRPNQSKLLVSFQV